MATAAPARQVKDVMTGRPIRVEGATTVHEAARMMRDDAIGDVLVTDHGRLEGLVTDRDLVVRALAEGRDPDRTPVQDVCSTDLICVEPQDSVDHAVQLMREHALRRLPVCDQDGAPVGIVTIGDLAIERENRSALADISAAEPNS